MARDPLHSLSVRCDGGGLAVECVLLLGATECGGAGFCFHLDDAERQWLSKKLGWAGQAGIVEFKRRARRVGGVVDL